jgi:hypothetical protein
MAVPMSQADNAPGLFDGGFPLAKAFCASWVDDGSSIQHTIIHGLPSYHRLPSKRRRRLYAVLSTQTLVYSQQFLDLVLAGDPNLFSFTCHQRPNKVWFRSLSIITNGESAGPTHSCTSFSKSVLEHDDGKVLYGVRQPST